MKKLMLFFALTMTASISNAYVIKYIQLSSNPANGLQPNTSNYWFHVASGTVRNFNVSTITATGVNGNILSVLTSGTERVRVSSGGLVGINTTSPSSTNGGLDIASGGLGLILGANNNAQSTRTNATTKAARMALYHYTNSEEPAAIFSLSSTNSDNEIDIGGGSNSMNASTLISFYTAASNTTLTGTERMRIGSGGDIGINSTNKFYLDGVALTGDTYLTESSANVIDVVTNGTANWRFTGGGNFSNPTGNSVIFTGSGTASTPGYTFQADQDSGLYRIGNGDMGISSNGSLVFEMAPSQITASQIVKITTGTSTALFIQLSNPGSVIGTFIDNQSNTSGSDSRYTARVAGTSGGDPSSVYQIIGGNIWAVGGDTSDNGKFKVSNSASLGTNDYLIADTTTASVAIKGTNTNNNSRSGDYGEYTSSNIATYTNFPATTVYGDICSISLTAGDWDVSALVGVKANSATVTDVIIGISTTTGNSSAGLVNGLSSVEVDPPLSSTGFSGMSIPRVRASIASTTTYYLKVVGTFSIATPQYVGSLTARRMR